MDKDGSNNMKMEEPCLDKTINVQIRKTGGQWLDI